MFTGRWLHELSVGWLTPLDARRATVAEVLGANGYATCGFVANNAYCAADSGLGRGFTRYHDFIFPELTVFKTAVLGPIESRFASECSDDFCRAGWKWPGYEPYTERVLRALV